MTLKIKFSDETGSKGVFFKKRITLQQYIINKYNCFKFIAPNNLQ